METIHDIIELLELYPKTFGRIEVCWYHFASNEHFMPLVYEDFRKNQMPFSTLHDYRYRLIMNNAFTVEMFLDLFGHNDLHLQLLYITYNPNVLTTDLHSFHPGLLISHCANINVNPSQLYDNDLYISENPRLSIEVLENLLKEHTLTRKCTAFRDYSNNSNATWEIVNDYSWCSWNWENIAKNAFSSSSLYRPAALLNELFELNIVYDYPLLAKTW